MKQGTLFGTIIIGFVLLIAAIISSFYYLDQKILAINSNYLTESVKLKLTMHDLSTDLTKKLHSQQKQLKIPTNLTAIWHRLDPIIASIELLPLKTRINIRNKKPQEDEDNARTWQQRIHATWQDLKKLVKIEQTSAKDNPRLHNLRQLYKREQLRLHLEQVRLGAMYNNVEIYQAALNNAINVMQQNFHKDNSRVSSNIKELQQLLKEPLSVP